MMEAEDLFLSNVVTVIQLTLPDGALPVGLHVLREGDHAGLFGLLSLTE